MGHSGQGTLEPTTPVWEVAKIWNTAYTGGHVKHICLHPCYSKTKKKVRGLEIKKAAATSTVEAAILTILK